MAPEEVCTSIESLDCELFPQSCFASNLYPILIFLPVWIRIHKVPEYGSSLDPDPQHWQLAIVLTISHLLLVL